MQAANGAVVQANVSIFDLKLSFQERIFSLQILNKAIGSIAFCELGIFHAIRYAALELLQRSRGRRRSIGRRCWRRSRHGSVDGTRRLEGLRLLLSLHILHFLLKEEVDEEKIHRQTDKEKADDDQGPANLFFLRIVFRITFHGINLLSVNRAAKYPSSYRPELFLKAPEVHPNGIAFRPPGCSRIDSEKVCVLPLPNRCFCPHRK